MREDSLGHLTAPPSSSLTRKEAGSKREKPKQRARETLDSTTGGRYVRWVHPAEAQVAGGFRKYAFLFSVAGRLNRRRMSVFVHLSEQRRGTRTSLCRSNIRKFRTNHKKDRVKSLLPPGSLRTRKEATRGLPRFSRGANGTVPLSNREVILLRVPSDKGTSPEVFYANGNVIFTACDSL